MKNSKNQILNQYLTFTLGKDRYGINIMNTREVLEDSELTRVPRMPDFMCGVINLRGSVVPVIDLKLKFKMEDGVPEENCRNNIIVTEIESLNGDDKKLTIGIFTDSVQKVLTIEPDEIEPAPRIGIPINTEFLYGIGKVDEEFIILLNINKILSNKDLNILSDEESNGETE